MRQPQRTVSVRFAARTRFFCPQFLQMRIILFLYA
jgi:hypothetical protein